MTNQEKLIQQLLTEIQNHTPWLWSDKWKTESGYWTWLRGALRSIWYKKYIPKNEYLNSHTYQAPVLDKDRNPTYYKSGKKKGLPVTRKTFTCEITGEELPVKEGQIDHIQPAGSLTNGLEACIFLFRLLTSPDNMRIISKDAHKIITHMERTGLSWDEAVIAKEVIEKMKQPADKQIKELKSAGFTEQEISNSKKRKECYKKLLENN